MEVTYRDVEKTEALEQLIREKVDKLEQVCDFITSCRVAVEKPQEHLSSGNPYRVRIDVRLPPSQEIVVTREPGEGDMHQPVETVIRHAFDAMRKRLKKQVEMERGHVKVHPDQQVMGFVNAMFPEEDYGFLKDLNGNEIYFHRNAVLEGDFDRMKPGTGVRFVQKEGQKGPQASTVQVVELKG